MVKHWHRFPREVVDAPSLEPFKAGLDGALSWTLFLAWEAKECKQDKGGMQRAKPTGRAHSSKAGTKQHAEEESALGSYRLHAPVAILVYFSFTRKKDKFSINFLH